MSTYLPSVFGENLMDVFDDFDRNFFRGLTRPEHVLYGRNAQHMMKTDVKETDEGYEVDVDLPERKHWKRSRRTRKVKSCARSGTPAQCSAASMSVTV